MLARRLVKLPHSYHRSHTSNPWKSTMEHPWRTTIFGKLYMNTVAVSTLVFGEIGLYVGFESAIKENGFMKFCSAITGTMIGIMFAPIWPASLFMMTCYGFRKSIS